MSRNIFRKFDNFQLFCILLRTNCKWVKVQPLQGQIACMSNPAYWITISIITLMIIETCALRLARSFPSSRYNHRAVII